MANKTNISWTDATWNLARGCTKIDSDCLYCYMYRDGERYGYDAKSVLKTKTVFNLPLKLKKPSKIFTSSLTDFYHPEIDGYRNEAWDIIRKCPQHTFQILTKRPERINDNTPKDIFELKNVWFGTSVGSNAGLHRVNTLVQTKAEIIFLSIEPLYEEIHLHTLDLLALNWVIVGGESGNETGKYRYRPCKLEWIEKIVSDCEYTHTPVFVKQLGTHLAKELGLKNRHGADINEFPPHLQIQDFPK